MYCSELNGMQLLVQVFGQRSGRAEVIINFLLNPFNFSAPPPKPQCKSFYNLMYSMDPLAYRLEPLLAPEFSRIPAVCIPRLRAHTVVHEHITASYQGILAETEEGVSSAGSPPTQQPDCPPAFSLDRRLSDGEPFSSTGAACVPTAGDKGTYVCRSMHLSMTVLGCTSLYPCTLF